MEPIGKNDFYTSSTPSYSPYSVSAPGSEPDMRQEIINTLDGRSPELAKSQPGLLRKMRRTSANNLIACDCVDAITKEPDKDRYCPICFGEGYLWDELNITFYRTIENSDPANSLRQRLTQLGLKVTDIIVFYMRYSELITREDKIVTVSLDNSGSAIVPVKRNGIFRIGSLWDYRSDNGKLEYWKAFTFKEDVKYLNSPGFEDL